MLSDRDPETGALLSNMQTDNPKLVDSDRAREIMEAGGRVHRDQRYTGDYKYIVDDMGSLAK